MHCISAQAAPTSYHNYGLRVSNLLAPWPYYEVQSEYSIDARLSIERDKWQVVEWRSTDKMFVRRAQEGDRIKQSTTTASVRTKSQTSTSFSYAVATSI